MDESKLKVISANNSGDSLGKNLERANQVLCEGTTILDKLGLHYWISAGTALGLKRDGELISHDTDIDVEVLMDWEGYDLNKVLMIDGTFKIAGFVINREMYYDGRVMQLAYVKDKVIFDIYFFYDVGDEDLLHNYNDCGIYKLPKRFIEGLIRDDEFPYPAPITEYLEWRYGKGWRIPKVSKQSWGDDCACIERLEE